MEHDLKPKKGAKTSEFWVIMVPIILTVLKALGLDLDEESTTTLVIIVSGAVGSVYAAVRTWLKVNRIKYLAPKAPTAWTTTAGTMPLASGAAKQHGVWSNPRVKRAAVEEELPKEAEA